MPLVLRPLAWRRQWNVVEGVDMVEKARRAEVERAAAAAAGESSSDCSGDTEPEVETSSVGDPEDIKPDNDTSPATGGAQEDPEPEPEEEEEAKVSGSLGRQSMDMDNDSEHSCESHSNPRAKSPGKPAPHNPQGSQVHSDTRSLSLTSADTVPPSTSGSSSLPPATETETEETEEKETENDKRTRPAEVPAVPAPVTNTNSTTKPPNTAPIHDSATTDWADAFD